MSAQRGAPTRPTPRQAKLLTVTSKQSKQQQAPRPQQQQQQRVQEPPLPFGQCEYCHVHDRPLKAVRVGAQQWVASAEGLLLHHG